MQKNKQNDCVHAFNSTDSLGYSDAIDLSNKLSKNELCVEELASDARKRALKIDNYIHAIAFNSNNNTRSILKKSDSLFRGIPTFVKDNIDLKGFPTGYGSNAFKPARAKTNGEYTKQFLSAGMNVLGKSTLPEFGLNASTEPAHTDATKNPWNLTHSAGASSGGAAALVAAGVVPIAHGNDGGGSIRIPAACCGLVGLKPSRNRHINERMVTTLPINLVSEGVLTRSVRDTAHYHWEIQKYYKNKKLPTLPLTTGPSKNRLRIGYYIDSVTGFSTDSNTRESIETTVDLLRDLGHHVDEIKFPVSANFAEDFALYWGFLAFMLSKTAKITINKGFDASKLDGLSRGLANHYQKSIFKTPFFLRRLKQHANQFRSGFGSYDVYLSPVLGQTPRPIGDLHPNTEFSELLEKLSRYAAFTPMANIAGTPAISLPLGRSEQGLPIGVQFSADIGHEQTLLELGYELEEASPWRHLYHKN